MKQDVCCTWTRILTDQQNFVETLEQTLMLFISNYVLYQQEKKKRFCHREESLRHCSVTFHNIQKSHFLHIVLDFMRWWSSLDHLNRLSLDLTGFEINPSASQLKKNEKCSFTIEIYRMTKIMHRLRMEGLLERRLLSWNYLAAYTWVYEDMRPEVLLRGQT